MAFTVEDGTGVTDANAYATNAQVITYWADRGATLTDDAALSAAIIKATDYIENRFSLRFKGSKEHEGQELSFPRINLYDRAGDQVTGMPKKLISAVAEYAKRALTAELAPDPTMDDRGMKVKRVREKVGPLEEETEYADAAGVSTFRPYPSADRLLKEYVTSGGGTMRA